MYPILFEGNGFVLHSHTLLLIVAFVVGSLVRRSESRRLGYVAQPGYRWVSVGALVGAVVGAKLGMLLYVQADEWGSVLAELLRLETSGKTVIGALVGGYAGVEIAKKLVGIDTSTGDAFAVAVPLSLGIGRIACLLGGCCYGTPSDAAWAVPLAGAHRHPVQLYEALLDFLLAALIFVARKRVLFARAPEGALRLFARAPEGAPRQRAGDLFKQSLLGYAVIRVLLDPFRGDARVWLGPLSAVQVTCLAAIGLLAFALAHKPAEAHALR